MMEQMQTIVEHWKIIVAGEIQKMCPVLKSRPIFSIIRYYSIPGIRESANNHVFAGVTESPVGAVHRRLAESFDQQNIISEIL
jgi:hypothetical protein